MIYGRFAMNKADLEAANAVIGRVFENELGLTEPEAEEEFVLTAVVFAEADAEAAAGLATEAATGLATEAGADPGGEPAGAGRLLFDGKRFSVTDVAVLPEYRGEGYGDFVTRLLADRAMTAGAQEIFLDALAGTAGFFETTGFVPEGDEFEKNGGRWQPMVLTVNPVRSCGSCGQTRSADSKPVNNE